MAITHARLLGALIKNLPTSSAAALIKYVANAKVYEHYGIRVLITV